jgi:hypothetical protein
VQVEIERSLRPVVLAGGQSVAVVADVGRIVDSGDASQITGEAVDATGGVIIVVDRPSRWVSLGLDVACQIVGPYSFWGLGAFVLYPYSASSSPPKP